MILKRRPNLVEKIVTEQSNGECESVFEGRTIRERTCAGGRYSILVAGLFVRGAAARSGTGKWCLGRKKRAWRVKRKNCCKALFRETPGKTEIKGAFNNSTLINQEKRQNCCTGRRTPESNSKKMQKPMEGGEKSALRFDQKSPEGGGPTTTRGKCPIRSKAQVATGQKIKSGFKSRGERTKFGNRK